LVIACLSFAFAGQASAAGLACQQDCSSGECAQVACDAAAGDGYCECAGAALRWGEDTYTAWCRSWRKPLPGVACPAPTPAEDALGNPIPPQPADLEHAEAMVAALAARNPYVATLLKTLLEGDGRWVEGAVEGLVHDSYYDQENGILSHAAALPFSAQVLEQGLGTAQIQVTMAVDIGVLANLRQYVALTTPSAVPPAAISGAITEGGLHGMLRVTGVDGKAETIQW
jgi:hypothetical protein